ncbi:MAG: methionyl-tRNA formyltransferase [Acidiferrobacterales bacterium]|nr:methionyl-tRNA formyltransferase [Acidiferrobacterales bacterium]
MNIVFAGTPEFAVSSLKAVHESRHPVIAVFTQPDRPAGRGRKLQPSPVKEYALAHGLTVYQPDNFKNSDDVKQLATLQPDVMVVVAYGLILPQKVLEIPRLGCLNVHASLLPRWRGAAPIQRAIEAGDQTTGVTIMQMDAGLDTGAMLIKKETPIGEDDTAATLHDRLASMGASALLETLDELEQGTLTGEPQNSDHATYAKKLDKAEAEIDWNLPAEVLARKVRAFNPWPVANCRFNGKRLRILQAKAEATTNGETAVATICKVDDESIAVKTGEGCLHISRLQLEGGRPQTAREFLNGHQLKVGDRLDQ